VKIIEQISDFLNPLKVDISLYTAISELVITKIKGPIFSIRAANKRGILNFSNSYYYNAINKVGNLFINGELSLDDFLFAITSNTSITDATYLRRRGKKIYGAKKIKNYVNKSYELLQDLLLTTRRYKGLSFIENLKIINHNKRHKTKPEEIVELIKKKIKKGIGSYSMEV
jgi:hypothetical protein